MGGAGDRPDATASGSSARWSCSDSGELEPPESQSQLWTDATRHPTLLIGLVMERTALYERIDARVDAMLAAGVQDEVRRAHAAGASATARKALGFEELLSGDVEQMKRRTRNYARRQLTWMRKLAGVQVIDVTGRDADASRPRWPRAGRRPDRRRSERRHERIHQHHAPTTRAPHSAITERNQIRRRCAASPATQVVTAT